MGDHYGVLLADGTVFSGFVYAMVVQSNSSDGMTGHLFIRRLGGPRAGLDSFWDSNRDCSVVRTVVVHATVPRLPGVSL